MIVFSWWLVFSKCELEEHWVHLKYAPTHRAHRAHPFFQHGSFFQNTTECHSFIERVFRLLGSKYELCRPNTVRYLNLQSFTGVVYGSNWQTNKRFVFSQNLVVFSHVQKTSGLADGLTPRYWPRARTEHRPTGCSTWKCPNLDSYCDFVSLMTIWLFWVHFIIEIRPFCDIKLDFWYYEIFFQPNFVNNP